LAEPMRTFAAPAQQPSSVAAAGVGPDEIAITWVPGVPGDCTFERWRIEVRVVSTMVGEFFEPEGCQTLTERHVLSCVASGLSMTSLYEIQVSQLCSDHSLDSGSRPFDGHVGPQERATLILKSLSSPSPHEIELTWDGGAKGCAGWTVEVHAGATAGVEDVKGCSDLSPDTKECHVKDLVSNTAYTVEVHQVGPCPELEKSLMGHVSTLVRTPPVPSAPPVDLVAEPASKSAISAAWLPGAQGDCVFFRWRVEVRAKGRTWRPVLACSSSDQSKTSCIIEGFPRGAEVEVRAQQQCTNGETSSAFTLPVSTLLEEPLHFALNDTDLRCGRVGGPILVSKWSSHVSALKYEVHWSDGVDLVGGKSSVLASLQPGASRGDVLQGTIVPVSANPCWRFPRDVP
jgi:hypothetical protein